MQPCDSGVCGSSTAKRTWTNEEWTNEARRRGWHHSQGGVPLVLRRGFAASASDRGRARHELPAEGAWGNEPLHVANLFLVFCFWFVVQCVFVCSNGGSLAVNRLIGAWRRALQYHAGRRGKRIKFTFKLGGGGTFKFKGTAIRPNNELNLYLNLKPKYRRNGSFLSSLTPSVSLRAACRSHHPLWPFWSQTGL